ncbi:MAG: protoglobin domain-containing protein [Burkholderiales bacterium]
MTELYFAQLCEATREFVGLTPSREALLHGLAPGITPALDQVTDHFYRQLQRIARAAPMIEGRLPQLRATHRAALEAMFSSNYDAAYVERLYRIGEAHVRARMPIEFMSGGMAITGETLIPAVVKLCEPGEAQLAACGAVHCAMGFSLMVMQESYQLSRAVEEQERFLQVTGISRELFQSLANTHRSQKGS